MSRIRTIKPSFWGPAGWVTDPAIWAGWKPTAARNAQLEALGNGVVPQQAVAALTWMATR